MDKNQTCFKIGLKSSMAPLTAVQNVLHGLLARPVQVAGEFGILDELPRFDHLLHFVPARKVIISTVDFAGSRGLKNYSDETSPILGNRSHSHQRQGKWS